jgi:hypothetical protein
MKKRKYNRMSLLNKDTHATDFLQAYYKGERKNVPEWADYLGITVADFRTLLTNLRKKGFRFHPLPIPFRIGSKKRMGIVVDITEKVEYFNAVMNRYQKCFSFPALKGVMGMWLSGNEKLPQLGLAIKSEYKELKAEVVNFEEKLDKGERSFRN